MAQCIFHLEGVVKNYSWGGYDYIPSLLHVPNEQKLPFAEYWLGTHPIDPSTITTHHTTQPLHEFLRNEAALNMKNGLPFLVKILDVRQMLSIQVHPNQEQAEAGWQYENVKGIPENDPARNYKDRNHKPEMMIALGEFWLLHGFKPVERLKDTLSAIPEFNFLLPVFAEGNYRTLYEKVMRFSQEEVDRVLHSLQERIIPLYEQGTLEKSNPDFWAARAIKTYCNEGFLDRGIFSVYFFNLVKLNDGEGVFQAAGLPHAYLEGRNVEVMSTSDNVLRAGLTTKHMDVEELLKLVIFQPTEPCILHANENVSPYTTPAEEFAVTRLKIEGNKSVSLNVKSPSVLLVTEGRVDIHSIAETERVEAGQAVFILPGCNLEYSSGAPSLGFLVTTPEDKFS